jgi:hypothetical protein
MQNYVIVITYHNNDNLTKYHIEQFIKFNPSIPVVAIKSDDFSKPDCWKYDWMWAYCDNIFYRWFLSDQKILADKYILFDYDTLCRQSVKDFFDKYWNDRCVFSISFDYSQNPNWMWFNHYKNKLENSIYDNFKSGVVPYSGSIMQYDDVLLLVKTQIEDNIWADCISELRIGTILNYNNIPISNYRPDKPGFITHDQSLLPKNYLVLPGIYHPVKTISQASA